MSNPKTYTGPVTGRVYDLAAGEKIDAVAEGLGYSGDKASPHTIINGKETYKRIFVRRKRPEEILSELDMRNEKRLHNQIHALCKWFQDFAGEDVELIFEVRPIQTN